MTLTPPFGSFVLLSVPITWITLYYIANPAQNLLINTTIYGWIVMH